MTNWDDRVHLGAELLDTARPGWEREIELCRLTVWDGDQCILGQLYLEFSEGMTQLDIDGRQAAASLGFTVSESDLSMTHWDDLNDAWKRLIRERLADAPDQEC